MRAAVGFADLVRAVAAIGAGDDREIAAIAALLGIGPEHDASALRPRMRTADAPSETPATRTPPAERRRRSAAGDRDRRHDRREPERRPEPNSDPGDAAGSADPAATGDRLAVEPLPPRPRGALASGTVPAIELEATGTRAQIEHHPLIDPRLARAAIGRLVARAADDGSVDLDAAIARIASARPIITVPRRQRLTLRFGVQVLVDIGDGMLPFAADAADFERRIRTIVGADRLQVFHFRDHPGTVRGEGKGWHTYVPPAPGTPALAISDLAITRGGPRSDVERGWTEVAASVLRGGCSLRVLVPFRAASPIPGLTVVPWEHPPPAGSRAAPATQIPTDDGLAAIWAALPEVYALARMVALTARCEPALLRRLRRRFRPAADAGDEAQLWASALVEARAIGGLRLRADAMQALLETWRADPELADVVAAIASAHQGAPSVVRWQEELTARAIRAAPDDVQRIDELLAGVTAAIASGGAPGIAVQLSSWTAHALPRLPDDIRRRPAAIQLAALGSLHAAGGEAVSARLPIGVLEPVRIERAALAAAASGLAPSISEVIGARATANCPVGIQRSAGWTELRRLTGESARRPGEVAIELPDTRPVLAEVRTGEDAAVVALGDDPVALDWRTGPLDIYGIDGTGYRVLPVDTAQRLAPPWTSLAWLDDGGEPCMGYLADPRHVVLAARGGDWTGVEPLAVCVGGVMHEARTAAVDANRGLVILALDRDASDAPLDQALVATRAIQRGIMALDPRSRRQRVLAWGELTPDSAGRPGRLHLSEPATPGMPLVLRGALHGVIVAQAADRTGLPATHPTHEFAGAGSATALLERVHGDTARLTALAAQLAPLTSSAWPALRRGALALRSPPLILADALLDGYARRDPAVRAAALLWWETAPSPHAMRHVLDALAPTTTAGEQRVAIRCALACLRLVTATTARTLAARIDELRATLPRSGALRSEADDLRRALSGVIAPHVHAGLPPLEDPMYLEDEALAPSVELLRDVRGGVFVVTGGNGSSRLGLIERLVRQSGVDEHPYVACAFDPGGSHLDALCAAAAPFAAVDSPAAALTALASAGACVVLDGLRWLWHDEAEAATAAAALLAGFAAVGRGHCLVTWPALTALPRLPGSRVIVFDALAVGRPFREILESGATGSGLRIVESSPITAVCALLDVIEVWVARALGAGDAALRAREAVLAWRERPWRSPGDGHDLVRAYGALGKLALDAMQSARDSLVGDEPRTQARALARGTQELFDAIERQIGGAAIRNGICRVYLGTRYAPEGTRSWEIAYSPGSTAAREVLRSHLTELAHGAIDFEDRRDASAPRGRLTCTASSSIFRRVIDAWRAGSLRGADAVELRWLAELRPLPDPRDTQKAHFGGLPERSGRIATAEITAERADWFRIAVTVSSLPGARPLRGIVRFHLHSSFPRRIIDEPVYGTDVVFLMRAWGSFTVGIECDDGDTRLELDLGLQPGIPADFLDEDCEREPWLEVTQYGVEIPMSAGTRWQYFRVNTQHPHLPSGWSTHTTRVTATHQYPDGTQVTRLSGFVLGEALGLGGDAWLISPTAGDYRDYHLVFADASHAELELGPTFDPATLLADTKPVLRLPTYAGARFPGRGWTTVVEDVRYDTLSLVGAHRRVAIYRLRYEGARGNVILEIAPDVGILSVTPHRGTFTWSLRELHEPRAARKARKARRAQTAKNSPATEGAAPDSAKRKATSHRDAPNKPVKREAESKLAKPRKSSAQSTPARPPKRSKK